jgi:membrane protease YdiL (CAAX protease family)
MPEFTASSMRLWAVLLGVFAAVLAPVSEIVTGSPLPYLLVLTLLAGLTWGILRLSRREMGLMIGDASGHLVALLYPLAAVGVLAGLVWATGSAGAEPIFTGENAKRLGLMFVSTWVGTLLTEEGFFRGALWGVTARSKWKPMSVLLWTSIAFMAWHIAVPLIEEDFRLVTHQIPVYYGNVLLLGLAWGLLRLISGSILVTCTAHASWNALVYVLFGYGMKSGALGLDRISLFGPERGVLGLAVNAAVVLLLLAWWRKHRAKPDA